MIEDTTTGSTASAPALSPGPETSKVDSQLLHSSTTADEDALNELTAQLSQFNWKEGVVDRAKRLLYSLDTADNIKGVLNLKAMLCIGREEVYEVAQEVIDSGVISRLVEFLKVDNRDLQWPAAFCLTNVAAGLDAQTKTVVDAGALDPLIRFLRHSDSQLRRQAIFCLANVAGSTPEYRILLARNSEYFPSMFHAAVVASDNKVLDLICWNLRNICLLGGPSFQDIRPGVEFLLDHILRKYWSYQHWSTCVRFAMETVASVCRIPEGRDFMKDAGLMQYLLSVLETLPANALSVTQFTFEALCWLVVYGNDADRDLFVRNTVVTSLLVDKAIQGQCGAVVQELSLKCLACIAAEPHPDKIICLLQSYDLLDISGQIFLGLLQPSYNSNLPCSTVNGTTPAEASAACQTSVRECSAFLFSSVILAAPYLSKLLMKIVTTPDVVKVLLEIIDFTAEQLCFQQSSVYGQRTAEVRTGYGPTLSGLTENTALVVFKALLLHLQQGSVLHETETDHGENPVAQLYLDMDTSTRLRSVLRSVTLPPKAFETAHVILEQLSVFGSQRSMGYKFACLQE